MGGGGTPLKLQPIMLACIITSKNISKCANAALHEVQISLERQHAAAEIHYKGCKVILDTR